MEKMRALYRKCTSKVPTFSLVVFLIGFLSLLLHISFYISGPFADSFNVTVGAFIRECMARFSSLFPFSLAECFLLLCIPLLVAALVYAFRLKDAVKQTRFAFLLLSFVVLLYSSFVLSFAAGYRGSTLDEKLGLKRSEVSDKELYETALWLLDELEETMPQIAYDAEGASVMPFSFDEMTEKLSASYNFLRDIYSFVPYSSGKAKPVAMSGAMSYTRILGVYTFFTGEANVNTNFNDFNTAFTSAHEMAHQRGFAREDEANMMAFLACVNAEDAYFRYAGYFEMLRYVMSSLSSADSSYYAEVWYRMPEGARSDQRLYAAKFSPYQNSLVGNVSGAVNDVYLKSQGTAGQKSYGLVVDLAVALHRAECEAQK